MKGQALVGWDVRTCEQCSEYHHHHHHYQEEAARGGDYHGRVFSPHTYAERERTCSAHTRAAHTSDIGLQKQGKT